MTLETFFCVQIATIRYRLEDSAWAYQRRLILVEYLSRQDRKLREAYDEIEADSPYREVEGV